MKPSEIRSKETKEIVKQVEEARKMIFELRLKKQTGQLANVSELKKQKKAMARMLTILREKGSPDGGTSPKK